MGMYTEIFVNVDLKEDTPQDIIDILRAMCRELDPELAEDILKDYPHRWSYLFNNGSYYTPNTACAILRWDDISNQHSLLAKGDIKNYENEIESFFEFIEPYVDGEMGTFMGYMRYEEFQDPQLMYKGGRKDG